MTEPLSKIPEGLQYCFGAEARLRRSIEDTSMSVFAGWSYEEISTPTVDYYSLFERGMGALEACKAFKFSDADGRLLALRPDITSGIARAAATLLAHRLRPLRLCYAASAFRQQRPSHSEWRRAFVQIGAELIGKNSIVADMEILAIVSEILRHLDLNYVITLNDAEIFHGVVESLALDAGARDDLRQLVDTRNAADLEKFLRPFASAADCHAFSELIRLSGKRETFPKARRIIANTRSSAALNRLEGLWQIVESISLSDRFEIDLGDLSNLDYYTGLTFKIYVEGAGTRVGSGGRYDHLTENFGKSEPAVGFVLDLEMLSALLKRRNPNQPESRPDCITSDDACAMFREALDKRSRDTRIAINPRGVAS